MIANRLRRRHLADGVDDAAGAGAAIKHGRRSAQHLDALEIERLQFPARIGRVEQLHAVEEHADSSDLKPRIRNQSLRVSAPKVPPTNARRVAQDLVELAGFWSRICSLRSPTGTAASHDRGVGLGARHRTAGDVALECAARILDDRRHRPARRLGLRGAAALCAAARRARRAPPRAAQIGRSDHHRRQRLRRGSGIRLLRTIDFGDNANTDTVASAAIRNISREFKTDTPTCKLLFGAIGMTPLNGAARSGTLNVKGGNSSN